MPADTLAPPIEPLAVDAVTAGRICGFGRASWWKLQLSGRCPAPIRVGRKVLWRVDELRQRVAAGMPPRDAAKLAEYRKAKTAELVGLKGGKR